MPGPPTADMRSSPEMKAWLERLQQQDRTLGRQNRALAVALAAGIAIAIVVLWLGYRSTIGAYAALGGLAAEQHPAHPGRIDFSFRVARPGQVHFRRVSGDRVNERIDHFSARGEFNREWSWDYAPGADLVVTAWYRSWFLRRRQTWRFPTARRLDVVLLIDTSQAADVDIPRAKRHCTAFAERVLKQGWQPRYSVVAFGTREADPWSYVRGPTDDLLEFVVAIDQMPRFPGDSDEGHEGLSLDALEEALAIPLAEGSTRRFVLVTDRGFPPETRDGTATADIAEALARNRIRLDVFSEPETRAAYAPLLGDVGRFYPLARFGPLLTQAHVLED